MGECQGHSSVIMMGEAILTVVCCSMVVGVCKGESGYVFVVV